MRSLEAVSLVDDAPTTPYELFPKAEDRQEIYQYSRDLAERIQQNQVADVVLVDRGARPIAVGIREYWQLRYPHEPVPKIFFVNPEGFRSTWHHWSDGGDPFDQIMPDPKALDRSNRPPSPPRDSVEVMAEFIEAYPALLADREKPVLVFDTCIHSGDTINDLVKTMHAAGFSQLQVGCVNESHNPRSLVKPDFCLTENRPARDCHPFGEDQTVDTVTPKVFSLPVVDPAKRADGLALRQELQSIIHEEFAKEQFNSAPNYAR